MVDMVRMIRMVGTVEMLGCSNNGDVEMVEIIGMSGMIKMAGIARWRRWFGCRWSICDIGEMARRSEMESMGFENGLFALWNDNGTMETPKKETHV
jgi:hypothetical protein